MKYRIYIFLVAGLCVSNLNAQSFFTLNSSYQQSLEVTFHNPAAAALYSQAFGAAGIHMLHTGLSDDNMQNSFLSFIQPIGDNSALGLRTQYFTSNIFSQGDFSLMYSRKLYGDILTGGINANIITHGYNLDNSFLFDFNDPVVADRTSRNTVSYGLGFLIQPIRERLFVGLSFDHLNKPDISLDESGVEKDVVINFGTSFVNNYLIPQFDVRLEGDDILTQAGIRKKLFDKKFHFFGGYQQQSASNGFFTQIEYKAGDFGFWHNFQSSLSDNFIGFAGSSHQIGISYTKRKDIPVAPEFRLENAEWDRNDPRYTITGSVFCSGGLDYIEIRNNGEVIDKIKGKKDIKIQKLVKTIWLQRGNNEIEIETFNNGTSQKTKFFTNFEPQKPEIHVNSSLNSQIRDPNYFLEAVVTDYVQLKDILVFWGDDSVGTPINIGDPKSAQIAIHQKLKEGKNDFRIVAYNEWDSTETAKWITFHPEEPPPVLAIDSPQSPISPTSNIILNLQLDNPEKIKEITIKINGEQVDRIVIDHKKLKNKNTQPTLQVKTRGMGGVRKQRFEHNEHIALRSEKNDIEVIAFDNENIPRSSKTMHILYNKYADNMNYDKKWIIVVGIDNYKYSGAGITSLDLAVSDADTIKRIFSDLYNFDRVISLYNKDATAERVRAVLSDTLINVGQNDLVVFYYAGHGGEMTNIEGEDIGYLVPHDGKFGSDSKNVSMDFLRRNSLLSPAKDILYIIDVCYGGLGIVERPTGTWDDLDTGIDFEILKTKTEKRARNIITAGGKKEPVIDGLFARRLKIALQGAADNNQDMYITSTELAFYLEKYISKEAKQYKHKQNPQSGSIKVDAGELILRATKY